MRRVESLCLPPRAHYHDRLDRLALRPKVPLAPAKARGGTAESWYPGPLSAEFWYRSRLRRGIGFHSGPGGWRSAGGEGASLEPERRGGRGPADGRPAGVAVSLRGGLEVRTACRMPWYAPGVGGRVAHPTARGTPRPQSLPSQETALAWRHGRGTTVPHAVVRRTGPGGGLEPGGRRGRGRRRTRTATPPRIPEP